MLLDHHYQSARMLIDNRVRTKPLAIPAEYMDAAFAARFWDKVSQDPDGCWRWTGQRNRGTGYGVVEVLRRLGGLRKKFTAYAHRVAWVLSGRELPDNLFLCRSCTEPACVNPDHFSPGDDIANARNTSRKGRFRQQQTMECPRGHSLTDESNVYWVPADVEGATSGRSCRACQIERALARYQQDPEHWTRLARERRAADPEKIRAYHQSWRDANREKCREYSRRHELKKLAS